MSRFCPGFAPSTVAAAVFAGFMILVAGPAPAHRVDDNGLAGPQPPAAGTAAETFTGTVEAVVVEDRVANVTIRYVGLRLDNRQGITLQGAGIDVLPNGARIEATGQRSGNALFVAGHRLVAAAPVPTRPGQKALAARQVTGTLRMLHVDYFEAGRSEFAFDVETDSGEPVHLALAALPAALQAGMRVTVSGAPTADGLALQPDTIVILQLAPLPPRRGGTAELTPTTNNVLVIMLQYANQPTAPFTLAQVQTVFGGGANSGSVTEFYKEASYGQQLLNPTYTGWLQSTTQSTPVDAGGAATCDFNGGKPNSILTLGNALATAAGFNVASYPNIVYLFPRLSACGWAGLAYIGWGRTFINGYNQTSVYGHELGHNFGLYHAASLRCSGAVIGGTCSSSEYGDPFGIMGNSSAMHFSAMQKEDLQWIPSASVLTQSAGASTYALAPLEVAGGTTYAVTVPTRRNRTYWMEYRQPIGYFDQNLRNYPNNGAQVRVAYPFESICGGCGVDTELLDMTPSTSSFTDATLVAGRSFRDSTTGMSVSVLGANPTGLSLLVQMAGQPVVADFNGDGRGDLLWWNTATGDTAIWMMNGTATLGSGIAYTNLNWQVSQVGDFDDDGRSDLVWRNNATGQTAIWLMNGTTPSSTAVILADPNWQVTHVADFSGDGKADLAWRNLVTGATAIWVMNGTAPVATAIIYTDPNWVVTYTGDFDGDGKADLVWRNVATGQAAVWLMNGTTMTGGAVLAADANWHITHIADFNADGKADLVWRNANTGATAMWLMNGAAPSGMAFLWTNPDWHVTHVADLNGDSKSDLLWRNIATGQTAAWLMNGMTASSTAPLMSDGNWSIARTPDVDGNGRADLVWRNSSTNQTALWLMNGTAPASAVTLFTSTTYFVQP